MKSRTTQASNGLAAKWAGERRPSHVLDIQLL